MIKLCVSGFNTGADIAGILAAHELGIETSGWMPRNYKTENGNRPEYQYLYNAKEFMFDSYKDRTFVNVEESDGTIVFANNFTSPGTVCTYKAIHQYKKPSFRVFVMERDIFSCKRSQPPKMAAEWISQNNIQTLNVAGNRESVFPGIEKWVERYMTALLKLTNNL